VRARTRTAVVCRHGQVGCESWLTLPASTGCQADHLFRVMALPPRPINVGCAALARSLQPQATQGHRRLSPKQQHQDAARALNDGVAATASGVRDGHGAKACGLSGLASAQAHPRQYQQRHDDEDGDDDRPHSASLDHHAASRDAASAGGSQRFAPGHRRVLSPVRSARPWGALAEWGRPGTECLTGRSYAPAASAPDMLLDMAREHEAALALRLIPTGVTRCRAGWRPAPPPHAHRPPVARR
jgi:hypothetical protein